MIDKNKKLTTWVRMFGLLLLDKIGGYRYRFRVITFKAKISAILKRHFAIATTQFITLKPSTSYFFVFNCLNYRALLYLEKTR